MRDVLGKMRECGKYIKMRDFPHDCGMVDTYDPVILALRKVGLARYMQVFETLMYSEVYSGATLCI